LIRAALAALLLAAACLYAGGARADERILSFDSKIVVLADGKLDVTEDIRVRAEGSSIRRGIYRDFPTRYTDRYFNRVAVDFRLLDVQRDHRPEPHFTEDLANGVRINTGNDDFLAVPAEYTFTIHYQVDRELGFFPDHDELYWNVTGLGWSFPIDSVLATVQLPAQVPQSQLRLEAYTGYEGAKGGDYQARVAQPGVAQFRSTRGFGPNEGMTLVVSFPKGMVPAPSTATRVGWILRDNLGVLVGLVGFLMLLAYYYLRWLAVGQDPAAGPIFPQYEPPADFSPAELRMLWKMGGDRQCFTADIVDMAVRGYLRIHGSDGSGWRLEALQRGRMEMLTPNQKVLATKLFANASMVELKNSEATLISGAISAHEAAMKAKLQPRYYKSNAGVVGFGVGFSILVGIVAAIASRGHGVPLLIALGALAFVAHIAAAFALRAPTPLGRKLIDQVEGLRMYLDVAERDELKSLRAPDSGAPPALDAERYEALLPYAMALEVEEAWTKKFIAAVGTAAAMESQPSWYVGSGRPMGLASVGNQLGSSLESQISSASTPPGSSSGSGGGGFSGGGGGGGGGGGR